MTFLCLKVSLIPPHETPTVKFTVVLAGAQGVEFGGFGLKRMLCLDMRWERMRYIFNVWLRLTHMA